MGQSRIGGEGYDPAAMKRRLLTTLLLSATTLLVFAQVALADAQNDHGEGWFGETNDLSVTKGFFALIAGFPLLILILSLIMWRLDKRKDARKKAEKARMARADLRGGW
jgi:TRAP-type C4-dicarboxylate transport system permease small subunit